MLKQLREKTPPILQLSLLIAAIIILVFGVIFWRFFTVQNEPGNENGTTGSEVSVSSLEPPPEQQLTETVQVPSSAAPSLVVLPATETATITPTNTATPTSISTETPTLSPITPTLTATNTLTPTPTPDAFACVIARNSKDNGFNIRTEPNDNASLVDSYGAVPGTRLEVLLGTFPEGTWWYVRLNRGVEGWANLGSLITGDLIELLPSCDE